MLNCCQHGDEACQVLEQMKAYGIAPNVRTFNGIINGCQHIEEAQKVLEQMTSCGIKMNAFTFQMLQELAEAYTMLEDDKTLRCGFLHSKGDHFTSGLDLADVAEHIAKGAALFGDNAVDPVQLTGRKRTKPVIVAVQGYSLTIAIELILANDICIAAKGTTFGQIEIKRGIFPFGGATIRFAQRCGWGNAMRYLLTGDEFDENEALRIGLIQEISDTPFETGLAIARTIAKQDQKTAHV